MTVLVAIPVGPGISAWLLDNAVRNALAQLHRDTVVLVAGDGHRPAVTLRSDRLVVGTFPTNMGAPATQQAMILGSPFAYYAPHGADDYIDPEHIASLAALRAPAAGSSRVWWHTGAKRTILRSSRTWIEFGLFGTSLLRAIGGYNPAEPCGQDSVVISLLVQSPGVRLTSRPTYHKVWRADSLTHDPLTRQGSAIRVAVKERNGEVLRHCQALGWGNHKAIRAYRESLVPEAIRGQLEDRVALVEKWLG